jgi:hypothetical protein
LSPSRSHKAPRAIVLLGSQRFDRTVGEVMNGLEVQGPIALITAGWQEREAEDEELRAHLGRDAHNLRLHQRAEEVFARDPDLAEAHRKRQEILRHKQDFYRVRLENALYATHVIHQRKAPKDLLEEEANASIAAIRALDDYHLRACARAHAAFDAEVNLDERPVVARHRAELREILAGCDSIAIAGGHVASMINRLRMFGIGSLIDGHALFGWAGGAMVLSQKIVLFHDDPPQGPGASEILDRGLALLRKVVVLPHPEQRLRLDDGERVGVLAKRFAPARCLAFPAGSHVVWRGRRAVRGEGVLHLCDDGTTRDLGEEQQ